MMPERCAARRFEDLIAWQKARELTRRVYEVTENGTLRETLDYEIRYAAQWFQLRRILQKVLNRKRILSLFVS